MKIKTSELQGDALNCAVSQIEHMGHFVSDWHCYSTNWGQGGPIIEREGIHIGRIHVPAHMKKEFSDFYWIANGVRGQTPLIAAMRFYVASKLGDEVEIPEELI